LISFGAKNVEHFLMYLLTIFISPFENCLVNWCAHLLIGFFFLLEFRFWSALIILNTNYISDE
jgi:hypothetical protein